MANENKKYSTKELPKRERSTKSCRDGGRSFIAGMTSRSEGRHARPHGACEHSPQIAKLGRALRSVGGEFSDIVKTTIFTTDVEEFRKANEIRYEYFKSDYPTGSLIGVKRLAHPDLMVEIEAMAVVPADRFKPVE